MREEDQAEEEPRFRNPSNTRPKWALNYTIDLVALSYRATKTAQDIYAFLTAKMRDPKFSLLQACYKCQVWDGGMKSRVSFKPDKPGALEAPTSCNGCAFSYLDPDEDTEEFTIDPQTIEGNIRAITRRVRILKKTIPRDEVMIKRAEEALAKQELLLLRVQGADQAYVVRERPLALVLRVLEGEDSL